ncbi:hypothetical protein NC651_007967 [Populus alba x Populus x berolinensis]|nr:hypothetical protein NC651_007967 [Populus alba x Populus x berolinensis]
MPNIVVKEGSRPPWVGLAAAVWVFIAAGNGYNFPLYSPLLKSVSGFNQQQITILGVANDIGESVGLLPGIACNKFLPWALLSVGVDFCFLAMVFSGLLLPRVFLACPIGCSMGLGNPTGALLVSGLLAGYAYDAEAAKQDSSACVGHDCFEGVLSVCLKHPAIDQWRLLLSSNEVESSFFAEACFLVEVL